MDFEPADAPRKVVLRINLTVVDSSDSPVPDAVESWSIESDREYSYDEDWSAAGAWSDYTPMTDIDDSDFAGIITTYARELTEAGISMSPPPTARVFEEHDVVITVSTIQIISTDFDADSELLFDVDPMDYVARYRRSTDFTSSLSTGDLEKIDRLWDATGRVLHNDLEWLSPRLLTPEDTVELMSDSE